MPSKTPIKTESYKSCDRCHPCPRQGTSILAQVPVHIYHLCVCTGERWNACVSLAPRRRPGCILVYDCYKCTVTPPERIPSIDRRELDGGRRRETLGYQFTQRQVDVTERGKLEERTRLTCVTDERHVSEWGEKQKKNKKPHEGDVRRSLGDLSHLYYWLDMLLS